MPTKSLRAPSYHQDSHQHSTSGSRRLSLAPSTGRPDQHHGGAATEEVQCLRDITNALAGLLEANVTMSRDSETEVLELLGLLLELFDAVEETVDASFSQWRQAGGAGGSETTDPIAAGQAPAAVVERVASRLGTLLHRGQPLQMLSRFLPLRLTVSAKLRASILEAIVNVVGCAARVERLAMEVECFGASTFNSRVAGRQAISDEEVEKRVDEAMDTLSPTDTLIASCMALAFRGAVSGDERNGDPQHESSASMASPFGSTPSGGSSTERELTRLLLSCVCGDSTGVSDTNRALAAEALFLAHHHWGFLVELSLCPVLIGPNDTPATSHSISQLRSLPLQHQRMGMLLRYTFSMDCGEAARKFLCGIVRLVTKRQPDVLIPPPPRSGSAPYGTQGAPMSPAQMLLAFLDPSSPSNRPTFELLDAILALLDRTQDAKGPLTGASKLPTLTPTQHASMLSQGRCYVLGLECLADLLGVVHASSAAGEDTSRPSPARSGFRKQNDPSGDTDCSGHGSWYWSDVASNPQFAEIFRRLMEATLRLQSLSRADIPPILPDSLLGPVDGRHEDTPIGPLIAVEEAIFGASLGVAKAALLLEGRFQGPTRVYPFGHQKNDDPTGAFDRPCDLILLKQLSGVLGPSAVLPTAGRRREQMTTGERYHMALATNPVWKGVALRAHNSSFFNAHFYSNVLQATHSPTSDRATSQQQRLSLAVADLPKRHRGMERLRLLRFAAAHAFSRQAIKMLSAAFEASFEHLSSAMLAAQEQLKTEPHRKKAFLDSIHELSHQQPHDPTVDSQSGAARVAAVAASTSDRLAEALLVESTLLASLMLTKSPQAREFVRRTVSGFDSWALNLHQLMDSVLRHPKVQRGVIQFFVLVDVFQCILNDGEQAIQIDAFDGKRIAAAMIREQEKRQFQWDLQLSEGQAILVREDADIGGMPPNDIVRNYERLLSRLEADSCFGLDTTTVQFFLSQGAGVFRSQRRPFTPQIAELSFILASELLVAATTSSLLGTNKNNEEPTKGGQVDLNERGRHQVPTLIGMREEAGRNSPQLPSRRTRLASPRPGTTSAKASLIPRDRPMETSYDRWLADKGASQPSTARATTPRAIVNAILPSKRKEPFRPTSTAKNRDLLPLRSASPATGARPSNKGDPSNTVRGDGVMSLQDVIRATEQASDASDYLSVALTMHLPVKFGPHYHRSLKAAVRQVQAPSGQVYVQPVYRNGAQSWSAEDVLVGELYVLFVPFHRLSLSRVDDEIDTVRRHMLDVKKKLVTTPSSKRSRRWFLTDMLNHILPKTELLLHELRNLLDHYSADDIRYQLSVIRATDEIKRKKEDIFESAVEDSDAAMPREILRLSNGRFKDVIHSGNLLFALHRLKDLYQRKAYRGGSGGTTADISRGLLADDYPGGGDYGDYDGVSGMESPERAAARMRELERHLAQLGATENYGDDGDEVESVYDGIVSARQEAPQQRPAPASVVSVASDEPALPRADPSSPNRNGYDPDPDWYQSSTATPGTNSSALDVNDLKAFADAAYRI